MRLTLERHIKPFGHQPFADVLNRLGPATKGLRDLRIGPCRAVRIGLQQNLSLADPLRRTLQLANDFGERLAFRITQLDNILALAWPNLPWLRPFLPVIQLQATLNR